MSDPHVNKLYYKISSGENVSYGEPSSRAFTNGLGTFDLSDQQLCVTLADHFADEASARYAIEPFLQSYEIEADLKSNLGAIRFIFERSKIIDRDRTDSKASNNLQVNKGEMVVIGELVSVQLVQNEFPEPPVAFQTSPDVEICHLRWSRYRQGKEPLPGMASFVLGHIVRVAGAGDRKAAAKTLQIDFDILSEIGRLSATKGNASIARKAPKPGTQYQEFIGSEEQWLEKAIRLVILRLGEYAYAPGKPLLMINLSDV